MLQIIFAQPLPFIIALLIGVATAWWMWGRASEPDEDEYEPYEEAEPEDQETVTPQQAEPAAMPTDEAEQPESPEQAAAAPVAATAAPQTRARSKVDVDATPIPLSVAEIDDRPNIAAAVGTSDDLKRIKGIGPKLEELCNSLGVRRFDQIAAWRAKDVSAVDAHLGGFKGRIARDRWVGQAKLLAEGKVTQHAAEFGD